MNLHIRTSWMPNERWSLEEKELLRELTDKGMSATQISNYMEGKYTRNAVQGQRNRLGFFKPTELPKLGNQAAKEIDNSYSNRGLVALTVNNLDFPPRPPPAPITPPVVEVIKQKGFLTIMQLKPSSCRWVEGESGNYMFCGKRKQEESSYCKDHHTQVYIKTQRQKESQR